MIEILIFLYSIGKTLNRIYQLQQSLSSNSFDSNCQILKAIQRVLESNKQTTQTLIKTRSFKTTKQMKKESLRGNYRDFDINNGFPNSSSFTHSNDFTSLRF
uniref:Uncharacterized protein n=1 Tax=Noccaea caerulescens TaxID=107243 RepID=A0A1J3JSU7_NOCCA